MSEADRQQLASIKELRGAGKPLLDLDIDWLVGEVERLWDRERAAGQATKAGER